MPLSEFSGYIDTKKREYLPGSGFRRSMYMFPGRMSDCAPRVIAGHTFKVLTYKSCLCYFSGDARQKRNVQDGEEFSRDASRTWTCCKKSGKIRRASCRHTDASERRFEWFRERNGCRKSRTWLFGRGSCLSVLRRRGRHWAHIFSTYYHDDKWPRRLSSCLQDGPLNGASCSPMLSPLFNVQSRDATNQRYLFTGAPVF